VYGDVPPVVVAVQVNGTPAVPAAQLTELVSGCPPTVTEVEPLCVTALLSLAALLIEYVPFGEHVTEIVAVVDAPVHPVGRVHV